MRGNKSQEEMKIILNDQRNAHKPNYKQQAAEQEQAFIHRMKEITKLEGAPKRAAIQKLINEMLRQSNMSGWNTWEDSMMKLMELGKLIVDAEILRVKVTGISSSVAGRHKFTPDYENPIATINVDDDGVPIVEGTIKGQPLNQNQQTQTELLVYGWLNLNGYVYQDNPNGTGGFYRGGQKLDNNEVDALLKNPATSFRKMMGDISGPQKKNLLTGPELDTLPTLKVIEP